MKKTIFIGRSGAGKTTLIEALRGEELVYRKTQAISYDSDFMDTPGEYAEGKDLGGALAVYSYESDVVALIIDATDGYSIFPPACAAVANRPVIGVVTKCDERDARAELAADWLRLSGCERIFFTSSRKKQGIDELLSYLNS